ncbi:hypothetical protein [Marinimicrococcus flavescens]|uniref:Uncharacterized protein n=1 Tax=Marinimicrococcus flavescens TaxID=3031815 RepID=A0AAP3UZ30_9PROT|nr:hypothetical protein [Marinimicrococcus flavescens]
MTGLRKRLLMSISAAALALPVAATGVQAIEVVVLEQVNEAAQGASLYFEDLTGSSLSATAAAIGNSAAFNVEGESAAAVLHLEQINDVDGDGVEFGFGFDEGDGLAQLAYIGLSDLDLSDGTTAGLDLTAAAIGNTLSGTGAGTIADLRISQINGEGEGSEDMEGQLAIIGGLAFLGPSFEGDVALTGLESRLSAAALGNSASLTAGAIGTGDDFDHVEQVNYSVQLASIGMGGLAVQPAETGAFFDATAAAIGNSLSLNAETGELFIDTVEQVNGDVINGPSGQLSIVLLGGINSAAAPDLPVGVSATEFETFDGSIVAAAIGNSATLGAGEDILLDEITQANTSSQAALLLSGDAHGVDDLTATMVAIGNSLSINAGGDIAFDKSEGGIGQVSEGLGFFYSNNAQEGEFMLQGVDMVGDLEATAAAIGNSLTIAADGDIALGDTTTISQLAVGGQQTLSMVGDITGTGDFTATAVAIGNSLSIEAGAGFDFGTYGAIVQENPEGGQVAGLILTDLSGTGAAEITVAAIGNSLSLDAGGELSGVGSITQENEVAQLSVLELNDSLDGFSSFDVTSVAIGNSLSLAAGSFEGTGVLTVAQNNTAAQQLTRSLSGTDLGAISATTATIGNSASVTIR